MENKSSTCHMTNEKRLIDANALLRQEYERLETLAMSQSDEWREGQYDECFNGIIRIKSATTVDAVEIPKTGIGDLSDGYHTFNELYHHRAVLFSVICNMHPLCSWKARKHSDGTMFDGMFIVGINTPDGPATYHFDIDPYWDMFNVPSAEYAPEWDGHTPDEAIRRIGLLGRD